MKEWIKKIPPFIRRNVRSNSLVIALLKTAIVWIPLFVGLKDYLPTSIEFCKSILLYAVPVIFDTGCFLFAAENSSSATSEEGVILKCGMTSLFVGAIVLSGLAVMGIFENTWFCALPWINQYSRLVYPVAYLEAVWYGLESISLFFLFLIPRKHKDDILQHSLSHPTDKPNIT